MESLPSAPAPWHHLQCAIGNLQRSGAQAFRRSQQHAGGSGKTGAPPRVASAGGRTQPARVTFSRAPFAAIIPGDTVVEQVFTTGISNFLNLYNSALIARLVLTWFPGSPEAIVNPLATLCDPYLNLFRGIIPPLGGSLDFSPILAFVTLSFFTNTAAALPCELGPDGRTPMRSGAPAPNSRPGGFWAPMSHFQEAWHKRMAAQQLRRQGQARQ